MLHVVRVMLRINCGMRGKNLAKYTNFWNAEAFDDCFSKAVGVSNSSIILDSFMRAKSHDSRHGYKALPSHGRLNGTRGDGWCAEKNDKDQWLQVDLGKIIEVCAVATQGDINGNEWVIDFKLALSKSFEGRWPTYRDANDLEVVRFAPKCCFVLKPENLSFYDGVQ